MKAAAWKVMDEEERRTEGVVKGEYIEVFGPGTFRPPVQDERLGSEMRGEGWVVAGAMRCGKTRLIDNLLLGVDLGGGQEGKAE